MEELHNIKPARTRFDGRQALLRPSQFDGQRGLGEPYLLSPGTEALD